MKTILTSFATLLLAALTLQAETITAEVILMTVPNQEALALAAKSKVGDVSGVSLAELQKLAAAGKARSEGTISVTSANGERASASQGENRLDSGLVSEGGQISGPLFIDYGGGNITTTVAAKSGDLIYLGSFTGKGETCMAFLKLNHSDGGKGSAN